MDLQANSLETTLFELIDRFKVLIAPETWENLLLNCTKNELLVLLQLYRGSDVNMSQISEYLGAPLNTVTGIVDRMERRHLVARVRSVQDKRVVTIVLTDGGRRLFKNILDTFLATGRQVAASLDADEIALVGKVIDKTAAALQAARAPGVEAPSKVRRIAID